MRATPASLGNAHAFPPASPPPVGPVNPGPPETTMEAFLDDVFSDDGIIIEDSEMSEEDDGYMAIPSLGISSLDSSICNEDFTEKLKQEFVDFTRENHDTIVEYATKAATAISFGIALWNILSNDKHGQKRIRESDDEREVCKKQKLA